jgi:hypothetical protein
MEEDRLVVNRSGLQYMNLAFSNGIQKDVQLKNGYNVG